MNEIERKIHNKEERFHLSKIKFHKYRAAIKKYAHNIERLNDQHMRAISELIDLNMDDLLTNTKSQEYVIYGDEKLVCHQGTYDPYKLLVIGFLYCQFSDAENHSFDLWLLANPKLHDTISKDKVKELVKDFIYVSVN